MSIKGFSIGGVTQKYDYNALENLPNIPEAIPHSVKMAMDTLFSKAAYADDDAASSYATFHAWATANPVTSISAVFTQGSATIYDTDSLDTLKQYLVVTATYLDGSTATVAADAYTLSGTLTAGTSTITVSYWGKTTTFGVVVSDQTDVTPDWSTLTSPSAPKVAVTYDAASDLIRVYTTGTNKIVYGMAVSPPFDVRPGYKYHVEFDLERVDTSARCSIIPPDQYGTISGTAFVSKTGKYSFDFDPVERGYSQATARFTFLCTGATSASGDSRFKNVRFYEREANE